MFCIKCMTESCVFPSEDFFKLKKKLKQYVIKLHGLPI